MSLPANLTEELIANAKPFYITDSIIVGNGEVPAIHTADGICWALPGGKTTTDITVATEFAVQLDKMITPRLHPYKRKIMRG